MYRKRFLHIRRLDAVRFEDFTVMRMMMFFFWVLVLCRFVGRCPEDGDSMILQNVGIYRRVYMAPKPRKRKSSDWMFSIFHLETENVW
jgi:hypothetical protein